MSEASARRLSRQEEDADGDNSPIRQRANSVMQTMYVAHLKPRPSIAESEEQKRGPMRSLGSSVTALENFASKELLERVPLYSGCSPKFLEALALKLHSRLVEAGTDIIIEGEVGDSMCVLSRGDVNLMRDGAVLEKQEDGAIFGEMSSFSRNPALTSRWWTVRASSLCDVKILYREDVLQVLAHFKDDANLLEKRVAQHIGDMQRKGALPAKKEWWQIRRHSSSSNCSAQSERVIHSENHDFRSAVGRTMVGIKLARRFSVGAVGVGATAFTQTAPIVPLPRRRMSDGMLLVTERTASKSSQLSLQSIMEQNSHGSASGDGASSSSSSSATPEQPEEVVQATHSILVHEPLDDAPGEPEEGVDDPDTNAETIRLDLDQLANDSRIEDDELPADVGHIDRGADATLEEEEAPARPVPSLPSLERSLRSRGQDEDSSAEVLGNTIKLPCPARRFLSVEEQRQRDVALHPFNQGGLCGGVPVSASRHGIQMAHAAALRVCRKAPINGAAARHQRLIGQQSGRVWQATVASKSRSWRKVKEEGARKVTIAPPAPDSACPMTLWQEFQSQRAFN